MYSIVYITTKDLKEARKISQSLLNKKLVACTNIIPKIESGFWWKGNLEKCSESAMICKTRSKNVKKLIEIVKKEHSYEVPDIVELRIKDGNKDFFKWIDSIVD